MSKRLKNFRDLGGIPTVDGKKIRHGLLYRSGHLCKISEEKAEFLRDRKGIETVVDLRSPSELAEKHRGAWRATVHGISKSRPQLSDSAATARRQSRQSQVLCKACPKARAWAPQSRSLISHFLF